MMTKTIILLAAKVIVVTTIACGQNPYLPEDLKSFCEQDKIKSLFEINTVMNPFYLRGDFDGDKKVDYAVAVTERSTGKVGMIIYFPIRKNYLVIGAGVGLSNRPGDDYGWMDGWEVFCKKEVEKGVGEKETIRLKGDAILVVKLESSSGLIYWDGKKYLWYQQGD
jgi:hypothetical protein